MTTTISVPEVERPYLSDQDNQILHSRELQIYRYLRFIVSLLDSEGNTDLIGNNCGLLTVSFDKIRFITSKIMQRKRGKVRKQMSYDQNAPKQSNV